MGKELLGFAYLSGRGVAPDAAASRGWFEKAAAGGVSWAGTDLARLYELGEGVPRDDRVALGWHHVAAANKADASEIALALRALAEGDLHTLDANERRWLLEDPPSGEAPGVGRMVRTSANEAAMVVANGVQNAAPNEVPIGVASAAPAQAPSAAAKPAFRAPSGSALHALAEWDALLCLNRALMGDALMQYELGIRYLTGDGIMLDRALGDAWLKRSLASFAAEPGFGAYAQGTRIVEARVSARLSADELERAQRLADHLLASVPGSLAATASRGSAEAIVAP